MKKIIVIFYMIILIVSIGHSQGKDVDALLCSGEWCDIPQNEKGNCVWKRCPQEKKIPDIGYTSYIFEKSGKYIWNTHPEYEKYFDGEIEFDGNNLFFWIRIEINKDSVCPEPHKWEPENGTIVVEKVKINLKNLKSVHTKQYDCRMEQ